MSSHIQLYPAGAEPLQIGQLWIIESLPAQDLRTGRLIREHVKDQIIAQDH
jgi:hypothetical protein